MNASNPIHNHRFSRLSTLSLAAALIVTMTSGSQVLAQHARSAHPHAAVSPPARSQLSGAADRTATPSVRNPRVKTGGAVTLDEGHRAWNHVALQKRYQHFSVYRSASGRTFYVVTKPDPALTMTRDVLKMVKDKVPPEIILAFIHKSPAGYRLSAQEIVSLARQGVRQNIITALLEGGDPLRAKNQPAQVGQSASTLPPNRVTSQTPAPAVPRVATPAFGYPYPAASMLAYDGWYSPGLQFTSYNNSYRSYIGGRPSYSYTTATLVPY